LLRVDGCGHSHSLGCRAADVGIQIVGLQDHDVAAVAAAAQESIGRGIRPRRCDNLQEIVAETEHDIFDARPGHEFTAFRPHVIGCDSIAAQIGAAVQRLCPQFRMHLFDRTFKVADDQANLSQPQHEFSLRRRGGKAPSVVDARSPAEASWLAAADALAAARANNQNMTADLQGPYHIARFAAESPQRPAVIMGAGEVITYGELDARSRKLARYMHANGIAKGDRLAIMMENNADYFMVCWAAQRLGLIYTPINWHLAASETAYIVENCGAKVLIVSTHTRAVAEAISGHLRGVSIALTAGPAFGKFESLDRIIEATEDGADVGPQEGSVMFYSSGTTGRPKGIVHKVGELDWGQLTPLGADMRAMYAIQQDTIYLVPAPLYHAAGLSWTMLVLRSGGTVVVMEKFDALEALRLVEAHRVTHAQFVPTMFVRMLRLSQQERSKHDLSSLRVVIHAAAPCPTQTKRQIIDWLGPIVHEYYAGSEGNGLTAVDSAAWCAHPGTVGKAVFGQIHMVDEDGQELPAGEDGMVYFSGGSSFEYFQDPLKTATAVNALGWSTLGDIGHLDEEGYLYLSDRRTDLIISGGVNIYPKEIEDVLIQHPSVQDVAVIGVPNLEFGHEVKAVVELHPGIKGGGELAADMMAFCRARIAAYKCPKSVDFAALPRLPNGKMLKREIRERYLKASGS